MDKIYTSNRLQSEMSTDNITIQGPNHPMSPFINLVGRSVQGHDKPMTRVPSVQYPRGQNAALTSHLKVVIDNTNMFN